MQPIENHKESYGMHTACFIQWFKIPEAIEFKSLQRRDASSDIAERGPENLVNCSFFHGKFKKYSASLNGESYILKMGQQDAPELPAVEYLCNQIASQLSIPVADYYAIRFGGELTFVTKNFMHTKEIADLQHIYHFRDDDAHSCEGLIQMLQKVTGRPYDVKVLIYTILFDALIGNHDRHGRNLAFIIKPRAVSLAPIYDNVSYLTLEQGNMLKADFNPTGKIMTSESFEPSMTDYAKEFKKFGFESIVSKFFSIIQLDKIDKLIDESFCSAGMKKALKHLILKRYKELKNEC